MPQGDDTDEALVRRFLAGEERAATMLFERLVPALRPRLRRRMASALRPRVGESDLMQNAFVSVLRRLPEYLTPPQLEAWTRSEVASAQPSPATPSTAPDRAAAQTQFVRINNNPFTAEDLAYSSRGQGSSAEVIPRGGAGAWHGDVEFFLKDDDLNARNAFAANKPIYQERQLSVKAGGPVVRNRLSSSLSFSSNEADLEIRMHLHRFDRLLRGERPSDRIGQGRQVFLRRKFIDILGACGPGQRATEHRADGRVRGSRPSPP